MPSPEYSIKPPDDKPSIVNEDIFTHVGLERAKQEMRERIPAADAAIAALEEAKKISPETWEIEITI